MGDWARLVKQKGEGRLGARCVGKGKAGGGSTGAFPPPVPSAARSIVFPPPVPSATLRSLALTVLLLGASPDA